MGAGPSRRLQRRKLVCVGVRLQGRRIGRRVTVELCRAVETSQVCGGTDGRREDAPMAVPAGVRNPNASGARVDKPAEQRQ